MRGRKDTNREKSLERPGGGQETRTTRAYARVEERCFHFVEQFGAFVHA